MRVSVPRCLHTKSHTSPHWWTMRRFLLIAWHQTTGFERTYILNYGKISPMRDEDDIPTGEVDLGLDETPRQRLGLEDLLSFQAIADELLERDRTRLLDFEIHKPAPEILISTIEAGLGATIPDSILSFYKRVSDGLDLRWSYEEDGQEVPGGQIGMLNFARVFGSWLDELWGVFTEVEREDFSWEVRGLEKPSPYTGRFQTVLHFDERTRQYGLYYYDPHGVALKLNCDYLEYIDLLRVSRGFYGWQFLISDVDLEAHGLARNVADKFHQTMPVLFPGDDFGGFRKP